MRLCWYGTAALMLEAHGYRLAVDPFLGMPIHEDTARLEMLTKAFRSADAVLVTHGHFDHIHDIPALYRGLDIPIYATETPCKTLTALGVSAPCPVCVRPCEQLRLGAFRVSVYQGRHCRFDTAVVLKTVFKGASLRHPLQLLRLLRLNRRFPENGETLFYEIESDGVRLHLMGSMGMDADAAYPTGADVLILPFQGTGNPAKTVAPIIARLKPKSILLDHYDDAFPPMSSQIPTAAFAAEMTGRGIPCAALEQGKYYTIGEKEHE